MSDVGVHEQLGVRASEYASGVCREIKCGDLLPDLSSGDCVDGEGDLCWVCECRQHRVCHWVGHRGDVVGGLGGGVLLRLGENKRAVWLLLAWMASVSFISPAESWDGRRVAWTSSVALTRFVWAVQYGVGVGDRPRVSCSRATLAVWIRKLKVVNPRGADVPTSPSADEAKLVWLVTSVRFGWTPREVLVWFSQFSAIYYSKLSLILRSKGDKTSSFYIVMHYQCTFRFVHHYWVVMWGACGDYCGAVCMVG